MERHSPLYLIFDRAGAEVAADLASLLLAQDEVFACSHFGAEHAESVLLWQGMQFLLRCGQLPAGANSAQPIFTTAIGRGSQSCFALDFGEHLAGGARVQELAKAYLQFAALLADKLQARAIFWAPARLLVDAGYFAETVADYAKGGVFPVLATVSITWSASGDEAHTSGLGWFSGQELICETEAGQQQSWLRRIVRLIHDVALNGAVSERQLVPDFEGDRLLELQPLDEGRTLTVRLLSEMDAS